MATQGPKTEKEAIKERIQELLQARQEIDGKVMGVTYNTPAGKEQDAALKALGGEKHENNKALQKELEKQKAILGKDPVANESELKLNKDNLFRVSHEIASYEKQNLQKGAKNESPGDDKKPKEKPIDPVVKQASEEHGLNELQTKELAKFKKAGQDLMGSDHEAKQKKYEDRADAANTQSFGDLYKKDMKGSLKQFKNAFTKSDFDPTAKDAEYAAMAELMRLLFEMLAFLFSPLSNVGNAAGEKAKNAIKEKFWEAMAGIQGDKFNDNFTQQKVIKGLEGEKADIENKIFNIKDSREMHEPGSREHRNLTAALNYQEAKLDIVNDSLAKTEANLLKVQKKDLDKREGSLNEKKAGLEEKGRELQQKLDALGPPDMKNKDKREDLESKINQNKESKARVDIELGRVKREKSSIEESGKPNKFHNPDRVEKELGDLKKEEARLQRNIDARAQQIENLGTSDPQKTKQLEARQKLFEERKNEMGGKVEDKSKELEKSLDEQGKRLKEEESILKMQQDNVPDKKSKDRIQVDIDKNQEAQNVNSEKIAALQSDMRQTQAQRIEQDNETTLDQAPPEDEPEPETPVLQSSDRSGLDDLDDLIAELEKDKQNRATANDRTDADEDKDEVLNNTDPVDTATELRQQGLQDSTGEGPGEGETEPVISQTAGGSEPTPSSSPEPEKPELTKENQKRLDDFVKSGESFLRGNDHEAKQKKLEDKADAANTKSVGDLWKEGMKAQAKSFKDTFTKGDVAKDENEAFEQLMRMIMEAVALLLSPGGQLVNALGQKGQNALKEFTFNKLAEYQGNKFNDPSTQQGVLGKLEDQKNDTENKIFDLKQDQAKHEPGSREHKKIGKELDYQNAKLDVINSNIEKTADHLKEIQKKDLDKREQSLLDNEKKLGEKDVKLKQELADLEGKNDPKNKDDITDLKERINRNDEKIERNHIELDRINRDREELNKPDSGPLKPNNPAQTEKELDKLTKERDQLNKAIETNKGPLESMQDGPDKNKLQAKQDVLTERRDQLNGKIDDKTDELDKSLKEQQQRLQEEHRVLEIQSDKDAQNDRETHLRLQDDLKKNEKAQEENEKKQQELADKKPATPEPDQQVAMGTAPPDPNDQTATFNSSTGNMSPGGVGVGMATPPGGSKQEETVTAPDADSPAPSVASDDSQDEYLEGLDGERDTEAARNRRAQSTAGGAQATEPEPNQAANDESGPGLAKGAAAVGAGAAALESEDASADESASADADQERTMSADADDAMSDAEDEGEEAGLEQAASAKADGPKPEPKADDAKENLDNFKEMAMGADEGEEQDAEEALDAGADVKAKAEEVAKPAAKGGDEEPMAAMSSLGGKAKGGDDEGKEAETDEEHEQAASPMDDMASPGGDSPVASLGGEGGMETPSLGGGDDAKPTGMDMGGMEDMDVEGMNMEMPGGGGAEPGGMDMGGMEDMDVEGMNMEMPGGGGGGGMPSLGGGDEEKPKEKAKGDEGGKKGNESKQEDAQEDDPEYGPLTEVSSKMLEMVTKGLESITNPTSAMGGDEGMEGMSMDGGGGKEAPAPKGEKGDKAEKGDGKEKKGGADLSKVGEGLPEEGKKLVGGICKVAGALLSMAEGVAGPQEKDTAEAMKSIEQFAKLVQDMAKVFKGGLSGGMGGGGAKPGGEGKGKEGPGGGGGLGADGGGMAEGMGGADMAGDAAGPNPMSMAKDMKTLKDPDATNGEKAEVAGKWAARAMGVPPPADAMVGKVVKAAVDKIDAMDPIKNTSALLNDMAEACHEATKPKNENEGDKALNNPDNSVAPMSEAAQAAQPPLKDMAKGQSQGAGMQAPSLDSGGDAKASPGMKAGGG